MNTDKIFKKYDIRGIVDEQLNEDVMRHLGYGFAKIHNLDVCMLGRDIRHTSQAYKEAVIDGLNRAGCKAIDIGVCSTAQLKWAVAEHEEPGAMMITASHNPPSYNGLKLYTQSGTPHGQDQGMHDLKEFLSMELPEKQQRNVEERNVQPDYVEFLNKHLPTDETAVLIDPSGGAACSELQALAKKGGYNWTLFNEEPDPDFREHPPNPLEEEAYETASEWSSMYGCISVVLDGDADRILFIDETGAPIPADYLAAWLAEDIVEIGAASTVNASRALQSWCVENDKAYRSEPVGWIYIQNALINHNLDLGSEKSGHIFFKDAHNAEAPLLCLLLVLKKLNGEKLSDAIAPIRESYHSSIEHNYKVTDRNEVLSKAQKAFKDLGEVDQRDGVLIEADKLWLSLRASNTEPLIRVTWEAQDQDTYSMLKERVEKFMEQFQS